MLLGDITDRGNENATSLAYAINLVDAGEATWIWGNHDDKLWRWLNGGNVKINYGLEKTVAEIESHGSKEHFRQRLNRLVDQSKVFEYVAVNNTVFAHGAFHRAMVPNTYLTVKDRKVNKLTKAITARANFGQPSEERTADGYKIRLHNWIKNICMGS